MKIATSFGNVEKSEIATSKEFRICVTPQAFKILSSTLYSRKIEAIIREIDRKSVV